MPEVKLGALCWHQDPTWPELLAAGVHAERVSFDTLWTWDQRRLFRLASPTRSRGTSI